MKNVLVFPCGSEVGLEIYRSLNHSMHFNLIGGSSVDDHGRFIFEDYIDNIPFHTASDFIEKLRKIVDERQIDAIFPAMDSVVATLTNNEEALGCRVIGSPAGAANICVSKKKTYQVLENLVPLPEWRDSLSATDEFPVFIKPNIGYGSRNVHLAQDRASAEEFLKQHDASDDFIFCELLPGAEYTVDCFTNRHGQLLFCGARKRIRISNGISVNTKTTLEHNDAFQLHAIKINDILEPRGAWFFQMKLDKNGIPKLLEVAARLSGSSSLFRCQGVNLALLSTFDCFGVDVAVDKNDYEPELDRALSNRYKLNIEYSTIYVDYDHCILFGERINHDLIGFIFSAINKGKKIILITRHDGDIALSLRKYRIAELFDEIIHLKQDEPKSDHINAYQAIFIDDSNTERADVKRIHNIPVFSPDMIEALM